MEVRFCRKCNTETEHKEIPRPDTIHHAELRCGKCNRFWGWKPKLKKKD